MALVRCVTEMRMGVDVHGLDYTAAAKRAVFDAIHHSSLGFPRLVGKTADDMHVEVTIGVPKPEAVDRQAVLETLPHGGGQVNVVSHLFQRLVQVGYKHSTISLFYMLLTGVAGLLAFLWSQGDTVAPILIFFGLPSIWVLLSMHATRLSSAALASRENN